MPEYKLTYFNMYGRAEIIRLLFAYGKVKFEDVRLNGEIPEEVKQQLPYGQVPILTCDGAVMSQTQAITRYLARKFDLMGSNDMEAFRIDEILDGLIEYSESWRALWTAPDEETKAKAIKNAVENATPKYFGKLSKTLEENGGKFLVGKKLSLADFALYNSIFFFGLINNLDLVKNYPNLRQLCNNIEAIPQIKEWIEKRPKTAR